MLKFFAEKMWVSFAVQKLLTFFSAKNVRILRIESAKTVNEMTLNELVKLTTLRTTGPWSLKKKTEPFIYQIVWNVYPFIYCPLVTCTHLLLVIRQISQSIHWIQKEQAASKNLWKKNTGTQEKWGLSYSNQSHTFIEKRGKSFTWQPTWNLIRMSWSSSRY